MPSVPDACVVSRSKERKKIKLWCNLPFRHLHTVVQTPCSLYSLVFSESNVLETYKLTIIITFLLICFFLNLLQHQYLYLYGIVLCTGTCLRNAAGFLFPVSSGLQYVSDRLSSWTPGVFYTYYISINITTPIVFALKIGEVCQL